MNRDYMSENYISSTFISKIILYVGNNLVISIEFRVYIYTTSYPMSTCIQSDMLLLNTSEMLRHVILTRAVYRVYS